LNNIQKCCSRDDAIVSLLNTHAVACTEQIAALLFAGQKYPLVACRRRLKSLVEHGRIARKKFAPYASNVYCVESWPRQWEHQLGVNWVYCWLRQNLKPGESLYHWQAPYYSGDIRPDALWGIRSGPASEFGFLEVDRGTNNYTKTRDYSAYYSSLNYQGEWWARCADRFPRLLIVTETPARRNRILHSIATDNLLKLRFEVHLLSEIRQQVISRLVS
jgi:hypothetical protein